MSVHYADVMHACNVSAKNSGGSSKKELPLDLQRGRTYTKVFLKLIMAMMSTSMPSEKQMMNILKWDKALYFPRPLCTRFLETMLMK